MTLQNITVAGSGVLGGQIAFQAAYFGKNVYVYDITEDALSKAKKTMEKYVDIYDGYFQDKEKTLTVFDRLNFTTDLAEATKDADVLIEAVPEVLKIKQSLFEEASKVAPEKTIFATNTSTMLPSQIAPSTDRPEKFLAMHFANEIWLHNTAEIMGHEGTDPKVMDEIVELAKEMNLVPIRLNKEQPGYVLNSLLMPFLDSAMYLWVTGVSDPQTIDKDWMISTSMPMGPFGTLDIIGMRTQYDVLLHRIQMGEKQLQPFADKIKAEFIDKGKLGVSTNEGFYKYPHPAYTNPNFLKP